MTDTATEPMPNPGSDEATRQGCTCDPKLNDHGHGDGPFWRRADCPLHGLAGWVKTPKESDDG